MLVRSYILYGQTALENIKASVQGFVQGWVDDWDIPGAGLSLSMARPFQELLESDGLEPALLYEMGDGKWALFIHNKELFEDIGSLLMHDSRIRPRQGAMEDSLVADIVIQALGDLASRLSGSSVAGSPAKTTMRQYISPAMTMPGSGIFRLQISIADVAINICTSAEITRSLAVAEMAEEDRRAEPPSLILPGEALSRQRVHAQVILGNAELTLDALRTLQVGDVIRLDESLSEPSLVAFAKSGPICKGFLGQINGNLAVQLDSLIDFNNGF